MACVQDGPVKRLRMSPVLLAVPRTTQEGDGRAADPYVLETPAGCTTGLTARGWFLVRFMKPVSTEAFKNFQPSVFLGQLPFDLVDKLRKLLELPRIDGV